MAKTQAVGDVKSQAVDVSAAPHWAGAVAEMVLDRDEAGRQQREDAHAIAAQLKARVEADGIVFFQRVEAEMRAAAGRFNDRIGRPMINVTQSPTGLINVTARGTEGAGFLLVLPLLRTEDHSPAPGAIVTERRHGREAQHPYDFAADGDDLRMRCAGELLPAEGFARYVLEPWFGALPLGGR